MAKVKINYFEMNYIFSVYFCELILFSLVSSKEVICLTILVLCYLCPGPHYPVLLVLSIMSEANDEDHTFGLLQVNESIIHCLYLCTYAFIM